MEELGLKVGQATKRVEQGEKAVAEKEAEADALGVKVGELKLKLESARVGCMGASAKETEANALRVKVGQLEGELQAVGQGVVDVDGTDAGSRFAVLQETLRESKVTGARLTEQLSVAREALRSTKRKSREACEALQRTLDEALLKVARYTNQGGWGGVPSSGSVSTDVWDGEPGSRARHLAAIKATGEALLEQVGEQLKLAKTMACRPGPKGITRKVAISELVSMLATLEARQVRCRDEAARRRVKLSDDEWADVVRTREGAEVLYWSLREWKEDGRDHCDTRVSMSEVVFGKTCEEAEGWMERYGGGQVVTSGTLVAAISVAVACW